MLRTGLFLFFLASMHAVSAVDYSNTLKLSSVMSISWLIEEPNIHFMVVSKSTGWVCVGFNPSDDSHKNGDFYVGYASQGTNGTVLDMWSSRKDQPTTDSIQNVLYSSVVENSGTTTMYFARPLDPGTTSQDQVISVGGGAKTKIVYAYGPSDSLSRTHANGATGYASVDLATASATVTDSASDSKTNLIMAAIVLVPLLVVLIIAKATKGSVFLSAITMPYRLHIGPIVDMFFSVSDVILVLLWLGMNAAFFAAQPDDLFVKRVAANSLLHVCYLFLPVTRRSAILRMTGIPFDRAIKYHRWLGYSTFLVLLLHCAGYLITWIGDHSTVEELKDSSNLFGLIAWVSSLIITVFSLNFVRRKFFELFYYVHFLFIIFVLFGALHKTKILLFMIPGLILYVVDRLLRFRASWFSESDVLALEKLPEGVAKITVRRPENVDNIHAGQYFFIWDPLVSRMQWHPFSLASSPNSREKLSFLVRDLGAWSHEITAVDPESQRGTSVRLEGPYGSCAVDWRQMDTLVLISGGIGVTPWLSVLSDICDRVAAKDSAIALRRVIFVWSIRSPEMLVWARDTFAMAERTIGNSLDMRIHCTAAVQQPAELKLRSFVVNAAEDAGNGSGGESGSDAGRGTNSYYSASAASSVSGSGSSSPARATQLTQKNMRTAVAATNSNSNHIQQQQQAALTGNLLAHRPSYPDILASASGKVGVLVCGPNGMIADAAAAVRSADKTKASFFFHMESFEF
eukprot:comp22417_c0_seq1/m.54687 comp22417_c0_seq1/g.54687  ORF comp22417_c0_seq1/g.54687 comp22417_c0_seq1/m.54687 type:complete len:742 (+) comp22417_c0_seq1:109-2334(+)